MSYEEENAALKEEIELCHRKLEGLDEIVDALKAENERLRKLLPLTPESVIRFIRNNYDSMEPVDETGKPMGDLTFVRYTLSVHDLLSAFLDIDAAMKETK